METRELLRNYDHFRREVRLPGLVREESRGDGVLVVRHLAAEGEGMIVYARLAPARADAAIEAEQERFRPAGVEWLLYAHDRSPDLGRRLAAHGFVAEPAETVLMLPVAEAVLPEKDPQIGVRRAAGRADLAAVAAIRAETWGGDAAAMARQLEARMEQQPERAALYLASVDGVDAGTAQITFYPDLNVASLASAATLPAYRRRGVYRALLRARLAVAQRREMRFVDAEASAMSRPLLQRVGFRRISTVRVYRWAPDGGAG